MAGAVRHERKRLPGFGSCNQQRVEAFVAAVVEETQLMAAPLQKDPQPILVLLLGEHLLRHRL